MGKSVTSGAEGSRLSLKEAKTNILPRERKCFANNHFVSNISVIVSPESVPNGDFCLFIGVSSPGGRTKVMH